MYSPDKTVVQQPPKLFGAQCPHCHEPTMANHLFCRACGASQIVPEFDRTFCPFCGIRVNQRQEFCHDCCAYLLGEETTEQGPERPAVLHRFSSKVRGWASKHIQASLVAGGLVFLVIACMVMTKSPILTVNFGLNEEKPAEPGILVAKENEPGQACYQKNLASSLSIDAKEPLQTRLAQRLNQIREAQLKKDINLFMSSFSPNFHELGEKRQKILKV